MNLKNDTLTNAQGAYQLLQEVTNHIISWAKPGMKMCELDAEARRMLGEYSPYFTHSLGHGVGLEIHESPRVSGKSQEILRPGMVITIEPGIYFAQNKKDRRFAVAKELRKKKEGSPRHPELVSGSIPDNASCTFADKSTKIIQGTKTRYKPISSEDLNSSRSNSLSPKNLFLNVENTDQNARVFGLRYEEMVLVDKEKLVVL